MTSDVNARVRAPQGAEASDWKAVSEAADELTASAGRTSVALREISPAMLSSATRRELNRALASRGTVASCPRGARGPTLVQAHDFCAGKLRRLRGGGDAGRE